MEKWRKGVLGQVMVVIVDCSRGAGFKSGVGKMVGLV